MVLVSEKLFWVLRKLNRNSHTIIGFNSARKALSEPSALKCCAKQVLVVSGSFVAQKCLIGLDFAHSDSSVMFGSSQTP